MGTYDSSLLEVGDGVIEVLSTNGNTYLGGTDIDIALLKYVTDEFQKTTGIDLTKDAMALQRVKDSVEQAKIELSTAMETTINLPFITADSTGPKHLVQKITRSKFESLIDGIVDKLFPPLDTVIKDAGISKSDINEVILVGGSTRIPLVQKRLQEYFNGKELNKSVNPDEVVAMGAAVQGDILSGGTNDVLLLDVTPLTLGIETLGGICTPLIEKNTTIPTTKKQIFSTAADNQPAVSIHILQGERKFASDNLTLGNFELTGIPAAPRGVPQIEVTFDVDANSVLTVSAKDLGTGKEQSITIKDGSGLSKEEIEKLVKEAELNKEADEKRKELVELKNKADTLIFTTEKAIKDLGDKVTSEEKTEIDDKIAKLKEVINTDDKEQINKACDDLQQSAYKFSERLYKQSQPNPEQTTQNTENKDQVFDV